MQKIVRLTDLLALNAAVEAAGDVMLRLVPDIKRVAELVRRSPPPARAAGNRPVVAAPTLVATGRANKGGFTLNMSAGEGHFDFGL